MSQNDDDFRKTNIRPEWGRRERPPLEKFFETIPEIIEKQIDRLFNPKKGGGGGNGGGGPNSPFTGGPGGRMWVIGGVLLLLILGLFTSYYTVDISEEAVVTRFGAYHRTTPSGIHFKIPFGFEKVYHVQSKKILQEEFGFRTRDVTRNGTVYDKQQYEKESLMLTGDLNVADVEWILQFRIADPWKYLFHARDVERNIRDVSMSIMRRVVGDRLVGDALTTGRVEIADQAKILSQEVLDQYDMGIKIEKIILQGANPPETVKPAFNEVNAAKQEQEQTINLAEREYNKVIPEARGNADRLIADAQGYAIDTVNRAMGNASLFEEVLKSYKTSPAITRRRIYLDTMEEVLEKVDKLTIVDSQLKGLLPIYTPTAPK
jgi:membrane protease subunit HflK